MDGHGAGHANPTGGAIAGDADGLVGADTRELRHSLDIGCGVVLDRRRPLGDDFTDFHFAALRRIFNGLQLRIPLGVVVIVTYCFYFCIYSSSRN